MEGTSVVGQEQTMLWAEIDEERGGQVERKTVCELPIHRSPILEVAALTTARARDRRADTAPVSHSAPYTFYKSTAKWLHVHYQAALTCIRIGRDLETLPLQIEEG